MTDYPTASSATYQYLSFGGTDGWQFLGTDDTERDLTEVGNPNDLFEPGELVSIEAGGAIPAGAQFTYEGVLFHTGTHGTYEFIVLRTANTSGPSGQYYLFSSFDAGAVEYPALLDETEIQDVDRPVCFLEGTWIATPFGETAIEALEIGDLVTTPSGRQVPVKWIGRQTVSALFGPAARLCPVRIAAGALGDGIPHTDLTVTADHGMVLDGVICHAGALVNGATITRVPLSEMGERYVVYHVETETQEIILANGAPAETFIDNVARRAYDNYHEFVALYGNDPEPIRDLSLPRAQSARQIPLSIRNRIELACA